MMMVTTNWPPVVCTRTAVGHLYYHKEHGVKAHLTKQERVSTFSFLPEASFAAFVCRLAFTKVIIIDISNNNDKIICLSGSVYVSTCSVCPSSSKNLYQPDCSGIYIKRLTYKLICLYVYFLKEFVALAVIFQNFSLCVWARQCPVCRTSSICLSSHKEAHFHSTNTSSILYIQYLCSICLPTKRRTSTSFWFYPLWFITWLPAASSS